MFIKRKAIFIIMLLSLGTMEGKDSFRIGTAYMGPYRRGVYSTFEWQHSLSDRWFVSVGHLRPFKLFTDFYYYHIGVGYLLKEFHCRDFKWAEWYVAGRIPMWWEDGYDDPSQNYFRIGYSFYSGVTLNVRLIPLYFNVEVGAGNIDVVVLRGTGEQYEGSAYVPFYLMSSSLSAGFGFRIGGVGNNN